MGTVEHNSNADSNGHYVFEMTGGRPCLDLANSVDSRPSAEPVDHLDSYDDLLDWSVQAGVVPSPTAARLRGKARSDPERARAVVDDARELREAIFEIFSAIASGTSPPSGAIESLNRRLSPVLSRLSLAERGDAFEWQWVDDDPLDRVLWPVVRSAADLLTSGELDRVRRCAADDCDWLFLDQSRNRSRRWCDMSVCGNRNKVRRFRETRRDENP